MRTFISYRREDTEGNALAHALFRSLKTRFGEESVFLDEPSLPPGCSFPEQLVRALDTSQVVLVIIGPDWLPALQRRNNDEIDWVRYEVRESLVRITLRVVPITTGGSGMPRPEALPADIVAFAKRTARKLDLDADFETNLSKLFYELSREASRAATPALPTGPLVSAKVAAVLNEFWERLCDIRVACGKVTFHEALGVREMRLRLASLLSVRQEFRDWREKNSLGIPPSIDRQATLILEFVDNETKRVSGLRAVKGRFPSLNLGADLANWRGLNGATTSLQNDISRYLGRAA